MKRRLVTVILFALVAAAASSSVLYKITTGKTPQTAMATARVLVAARDLSAGAMIGEADVREVQWPVAGASPWIGRLEDVTGRALLSGIGKDEPFAESRLAGKGAGAGLASRIPSGMRALAVHVDELTGPRFILPGMHVDVISTGTSGSLNGQGMTARTILQNIEVFSTGQSVERDAKEKPAAVPVVNLLVTPRQAEVLSQAVAQTRIELVLRNPMDKGSFLPEATAVEHSPFDTSLPKLTRAIFRTQSAEMKPPKEKTVVPLERPQPAAPGVEVIHGTRRTFSAVAVATSTVAVATDSEPKQ